MRGSVVLFSVLVLASCQKAEEKKPAPELTPKQAGSGAGISQRPKPDQVAPPVDLKNPPTDAVKTASGLIYKKLVANDAGTAPKRNDTVMINYTGWKQSTGETFFSNKTRGQPMPLNLATTAPGFTEAMQLLHKGERAVLWVPPSIGYKGQGPQGTTPETLCYEVEVVEVVPAPEVPADVAKPPDTAESTKSGYKYVVIRPGTGKDKAKPYDNLTFNYTAWDADGRMFDSTETRKRPAKVAPYRQPGPFAEVLTSMTAGERVRFWAPSEKMNEGKTTPGMPKGQLCYEVEIVQIEKGSEPPVTPPDVAKPPEGVKKTAKGVFYKVLKSGKGGPHPKATDTVRVHYTGWTTDGKLFDSSVVRNEPAEFSLQAVIAGWTDGITVMSVGDKVRFWIPEELAYKGQQGRPQGMLVFDVELLEIKAPAHPDAPPHP
ncbi:MAG: peptidylprolyl isomerase FKBP-type [Myxococcales bacterium]|nr:peptidylprolyl isomerase FKBP-type [Myxococcales bacterium]